MAYAIKWDQNGERLYETGVQKCVLYVGTEAAAWNGVTAITESPSGAEATALYADDIKYLNLMSNEEFGATIEAYTYPELFAQCNGEKELVPGVTLGQQTRTKFNLCYRTTLGNDVDGNEHGYKLHFIYNCQAAPSERAYATINDSPEAITFSWELTTTPEEVVVDGVTAKPTACITIDSTKFEDTAGKAKLEELESYIYGTAGSGQDGKTGAIAPQFPTPAKIAELLGDDAA